MERRQFFQERCTKEYLFLQNCARGLGVGRLGVGRRINDFVDYSTEPPSRSHAGPLIEHSFFFSGVPEKRPSWPIGFRQPFKPTSRFEVLQWEYFTDTSSYGFTETNPKVRIWFGGHLINFLVIKVVNARETHNLVPRSPIDGTRLWNTVFFQRRGNEPKPCQTLFSWVIREVKQPQRLWQFYRHLKNWMCLLLNFITFI